MRVCGVLLLPTSDRTFNYPLSRALQYGSLLVLVQYDGVVLIRQTRESMDLSQSRKGAIQLLDAFIAQRESNRDGALQRNSSEGPIDTLQLLHGSWELGMSQRIGRQGCTAKRSDSHVDANASVTVDRNMTGSCTAILLERRSHSVLCRASGFYVPADSLAAKRRAAGTFGCEDAGTIWTYGGCAGVFQCISSSQGPMGRAMCGTSKQRSQRFLCKCSPFIGRNSPRQFISMGLSKTGTTSLSFFLRTLGLNVAQNKGDGLAKGYHAITNAIEWAYPSLDHLYPCATWILTHSKNRTAWLASLQDHLARVGPTQHGLLSGFLHCGVFGCGKGLPTNFSGDERKYIEVSKETYQVTEQHVPLLLEAYDLYYERLFQYFSGRAYVFIDIRENVYQNLDLIAPNIGTPFPAYNTRQYWDNRSQISQVLEVGDEKSAIGDNDQDA